MKYIADVSRFTPHLTRGWETLRSLVMDGVKAWDLGEGRKVVHCEHCAGVEKSPLHIIAHCPFFDGNRTSAYTRTYELMQRNGLMHKAWTARNTAQNLVREGVLAGMKDELSSAPGIHKVLRDPMSGSTMRTRAEMKLWGLNKALMVKYQVDEEKRKELLEGCDSQWTMAQREMYIRYTKLYEFLRTCLGLNDLHRTWDTEFLTRRFTTLSSLVNVNRAGFIRRVFHLTYLASLLTDIDAAWYPRQ